MPSTRAWYRHHSIMVDHPRYDSTQQMPNDRRPPEVWGNTRMDKIKVYCAPCLEVHVGQQMEKDAEEHRPMRSRERIILDLFNVPSTAPHRCWMEARRETLLKHIKDCQHQPEHVRQPAKEELKALRAQNQAKDQTPRAPVRTYSFANHATTGPQVQPMVVSPQPVRHHVPPPVLQYQQPPAAGFSVPEQMELRRRFDAGSEMPIPYLDPSQQLPAAYSTNHSNFGRVPNLTYPSHMAARWDPPNDPFLDSDQHSSFGERTLSRTASLRSISDSRPESVASFSSKRSRTSYGHGIKRPASSQLDGSPYPPWTDEDQEHLDINIARLIVCGDLPISVAENPELINLILKLAPRAKIPSRKRLTQTIIPRLVREKRQEAQQKAAGSLLTVQCDGWTGENSHHLVAFMATSPEDVNTVKVYDTTAERKTAPNLLKMMEATIATLQTQWGAEVTSLTSDASGESRAARRLLKEKFPELVVPDCFAHQVALVLGNYLNTKNTDFLHAAAEANELITWLRSKTAITGLIHKDFASRGKPPMSIIRPVPTRWTAHYLAFERLLKLRGVLTRIVEEDADERTEDARLIISKSLATAAREKAEKMVACIQNPDFWLSLTRIVRHLRPLAIAANATQGDHTRLDEVGVTLAKLAFEFSKMDEPEVRKSVIDSIERRWANSDRDVIIASIFLNPFHKTDLFKLDPMRTSISAMHTLLSRLWKRFYKEDPPPALYNDLVAYIECTGVYQLMQGTCAARRQVHKSSETRLDPIRIYHDMGSFENGRRAENLSPIVRLAVRTLSICGNSASCERLFSTFGLILTKLRTRLTMDTLVNIAELKMFIRDEHRRNKAVRDTARHRYFGHRQTPAATREDTPSGQMQPQTHSTTPSSAPHVGNASNTDAVTDDTPLSNTEPNASTGSPPRGLSAIASRLAQLDAVDAEYNSQGILRATDARSIETALNVPLMVLFDFERPMWKHLDDRVASNRLETELELYGLLDLDAPGEADLDPDVDDSIAEFIGL